MKIFLEVSASAMVKLKAGNKSNVNYNLAKRSRHKSFG